MLVDWEKLLDGKVVIVIGVVCGIGVIIVEVFVCDGVYVVVIDVEFVVENLVEIVSKVGGIVLWFDVIVDDVVDKISEYLCDYYGGKVDILVNNVGIICDKLLVNMDDVCWDVVLVVNLFVLLWFIEGLVGNGSIGEGGWVIGLLLIVGIVGNCG